MASTINALEIYRRLGKTNWKPPVSWGDGFIYKNRSIGQIIVSPVEGFEELDEDWIHASISRVSFMPSYEDMKLMHQAVFGDGFAYQVFAPPSQHVNYHEYALHLWGRTDGKSAIPNFGELFYKSFGTRMI